MNEQTDQREIRVSIRTALYSISDSDFSASAQKLLDTLGYKSQRTLPDQTGKVDDFINTFPAYLRGDTNKRNMKSDEMLCNNIDHIQFLFQFTDDEIAASDNTQLNMLFSETNEFDESWVKSFFFVVAELRDKSYPRGRYAQLTREINRRFSQPAVILFKTHSNLLTLAFVHRRVHKRNPERDVLGKVTLVRQIDPNRPHRAHLDILSELSLFECLYWMDAKKQKHNFDGLLAAWLDKLNTDKLNQKFYKELFDWFIRAVDESKFPTDEARTLPGEEHIIRLITRLLFVWFIKEKGLVSDDLFNEAKISDLLVDYDRETGDSYYRTVLQNLFFATLNTEINKRGFSKGKNTTHRNFALYRYQREIRDQRSLLALFDNTPFINGGLFDCLDSEEATTSGGYRIDCFSDVHYKKLSIPNRLFFDEDGLFPLLNHYKFTVEENTPIEQEVALDPELLGRVFENLLAAYNPETRETARKQTGSYYTPRSVVDYMVDEALVTSLAANATPKDGDMDFWKERLRYLLDYGDAFNDAHVLFEREEAENIVNAIADMKVLDPAVGSGAFPMGVLHKLTLALQRIDPENQHWEELQKERAKKKADEAFDTKDKKERDVELLEISETFERYSSDFGRKLYLIQNSVFGVDIQPVACQIAKLRFFISLAIEQEPDRNAENFGIKPLPNLETNFVVANTLLGLDRPVQMTMGQGDIVIAKLEQQLNENRERHFHATTRGKKLACRDENATLRRKLAEELKGNGFSIDAAEKIAQWDAYDQNKKADWFDPEYMFGVNDGFDIVIGNPPYISHDKIQKRLKQEIKKKYLSYQSFADLYCYFIEKAVKLQNDHGVLSFITSNSYLRAEYGEPIRKFLRSKNILLRLISIEDSQVFESAIVNVAILVSRNLKKLSDEFCLVVNSPYIGNSFEDYVKSNGFNYPQSNFDLKSWNLVKPCLLDLYFKIKSVGKTLEQLSVKIRLGIATGSNEAFIIDGDKKEELCENSSINARVIKPILRGRDIDRYSYTLPGKYILLTKNGVNVKEDYPKIYKHLESFGEKFKNRGAQGKHWANLRACSFYDDFKKEKIVWIELTDIGRFALCKEEVYLLNTAYYLLPPRDIDSKFLLGILNSRTIRFYLDLIAETSGMGTNRWINNYVKEFPIPIVSRNKQTDISNIVSRP